MRRQWHTGLALASEDVSPDQDSVGTGFDEPTSDCRSEIISRAHDRSIKAMHAFRRVINTCRWLSQAAQLHRLRVSTEKLKCTRSPHNHTTDVEYPYVSLGSKFAVGCWANPT
jgi:hypothetical protein